MIKFTMNQGQQDAADKFFQFLLSSTQKEFAIRGPAGTGKTVLLQNLINKVLPNYHEACKLMGLDPIIRDIALTATTNRAVDVLAGSMDLPCSTIHSFMNLRVYDDYSTGRQRIQKTDRFRVHHRTLIFIDEASMIDKKLYEILLEGTAGNCKLVYVGDHCQLSPVGEEISKVFMDNIPYAELTQPMRNAKQQALVDLCGQFRETVKTGVFKPIPHVPGAVEYLTNERMRQHVDNHFFSGEENTRILAYTNVQVQAYNQHIRQLRGFGPWLVDGEQIVNNSACKIRSNVIPAERQFIARMDTKPLQSSITVSGAEVETYEVTLEDAKHHGIIRAVQAKHPNHLRDVMKHFKKHKAWQEYYHFKNNIPDLRPRDASTVHKAQGSTFDTVYVDLENIGKCNMVNQAARMLYVALSRPTTTVFLHGKLPARYGG